MPYLKGLRLFYKKSVFGKLSPSTHAIHLEAEGELLPRKTSKFLFQKTPTSPKFNEAYIGFGVSSVCLSPLSPPQL